MVAFIYFCIAVVVESADGPFSEAKRSLYVPT
jgi:hypothetical protein